MFMIFVAHIQMDIDILIASKILISTFTKHDKNPVLQKTMRWNLCSLVYIWTTYKTLTISVWVVCLPAYCLKYPMFFVWSNCLVCVV